jgi:hypothetical protein
MRIQKKHLKLLWEIANVKTQLNGIESRQYQMIERLIDIEYLVKELNIKVDKLKEVGD